jgi:DNA replication and repair protein RecF
MLSLQKITITHFKNYDISSFNFTHNIVGICGSNGIGKTNLLDAIYYTCFTKSYFTTSDTLNIGFGKEGFRIEASFIKDTVAQKLICVNKANTKKEFSNNDVLYEKLSQHIGLFPAVIIAPDDIEIINASSELRRKFIDTILCQIDKNYLQQLIVYNKVLQQRNSYLKKVAETGKLDLALLEIIDNQLSVPCKYIYDQRLIFTERFIKWIHVFYQEIAQKKEPIQIHYQSKLHEFSFDDLLIKNREKDRLLQRTNAGIHKDDLDFIFDDQPFKNIASQGQKKSLLFALKLAEYEIIKEAKGFAPILLLDDVFEKLDDTRMTHLLNRVCKEKDGQVFITDTHKDRLELAFEKLKVDGQIIELH